jgi:8-oxo-dGTP pyrophosphatase MutT (NUDIX family)
MLELLRSPADPFTRSHFVPGHFTASAFILSPDRASVLLIFHSKLMRWLQPGGHVSHEDADVLATARREVAEEVALSDVSLAHDGIFDIDVHDIPPLRGEPAHQHFDVRFLFLAPSLTMSAGSDATSARWQPLDRLVASVSDESVLRALRKVS